MLMTSSRSQANGSTSSARFTLKSAISEAGPRVRQFSLAMSRRRCGVQKTAGSASRLKMLPVASVRSNVRSCVRACVHVCVCRCMCARLPLCAPLFFSLSCYQDTSFLPLHPVYLSLVPLPSLVGWLSCAQRCLLTCAIPCTLFLKNLSLFSNGVLNILCGYTTTSTTFF